MSGWLEIMFKILRKLNFFRFKYWVVRPGYTYPATVVRGRLNPILWYNCILTDGPFDSLKEAVLARNEHNDRQSVG